MGALQQPLAVTSADILIKCEIFVPHFVPGMGNQRFIAK